ncbi:hypothetical protein IWX91DRAFT_348082 [Phyllosticta citricarpa]
MQLMRLYEVIYLIWFPALTSRRRSKFFSAIFSLAHVLSMHREELMPVDNSLVLSSSLKEVGICLAGLVCCDNYGSERDFFQ